MTAKRPPRLDLNPSSADRWTTCTASPRFIMENYDKVPLSDTFYNQQGTTAHAVAAAYLQGSNPNVPLSSECPVPADADMLWHGWNYAEYVESFRQPGSKLLVEQKLPLWYMRERNAIVDAAVINPTSLHVFDYKYGEGVPVSPVENLQTAIYAMSVGLLSGVPLPSEFPVYIHIYQPRGRAAEDGAAHVWETTWLELSKLTQKVNDVAKGIQDGSELPMFAPSEKACRWCPAKGFCSERQRSLTSSIDVLAEFESEPIELIRPAALSDEQIGRVLELKNQIEKWLGDVAEYATEHLRGGGKLPGWKLVTSRGGNRQWSDPKKAAALLLAETVLKREEVIEEKVISPGGAEKLVGKRKFSAELTALITKAPGVPVLAPEGDERAAVVGVLDDFEKLV